MEKAIFLSIQVPNGTIKTIQVSSLETPRKVLQLSHIKNSKHSKVFIFYKGQELHMDLSLASQNVTNSSTLKVVVQKLYQRSFHIFHFSSQSSLDPMVSPERRKQNELYMESLRMYDLASLIFDNSKSSLNYYQSIMNNEDDDSDSSAIDEVSYPEASKAESAKLKQVIPFSAQTPQSKAPPDIAAAPSISEQPLPSPWSNDFPFFTSEFLKDAFLEALPTAYTQESFDSPPSHQ